MSETREECFVKTEELYLCRTTTNRSENDSCLGCALTVTEHYSRPDERRRIELAGGMVVTVGVARVGGRTNRVIGLD